MNAHAYHYTYDDLVTALERVGVRPGGTVFVHVSLGRLGYSNRGRTMLDSCTVLHDALRQAVGPRGTVLVPAYTYSIGRRELFDVSETPATTGEFTEFFRRQENAVRSAEPMLSVAGIGPDAERLLTNLPHTCYGRDSVYDRLYESDARIVTVGLGLHWATYRHYIEEYVRVPFRFHKLFKGVIREHGHDRTEIWTYYAAPLIRNCNPNGLPLEKRMRDEGVCVAATVGRGEICSIGCKEYRDYAVREFARDPWISAEGPPLSFADLVAAEDARVSSRRSDVCLRRDASMLEMMAALAPLRRDIVSDGYDAGLAALASVIPLAIHEFPTGSECLTWVVPEKWTCHEAWLESMDGQRLFSTADHPAHVMSYSLPYEGTVSRDELFQHLHSHPALPDAIPFVCAAYTRDWGLCSSQATRESLDADRYRVVIRSNVSYSSLKVGEAVVPGQTDETILLCANLLGLAGSDAGVSGVAVGMEVMRRLMLMPARRYTYRFLILPGTTGVAAWLNAHALGNSRVAGGIFLTTLATSHPFTLQHSPAGDTELDRCCELALRHLEPAGTIIPFAAGDEASQFNAPGFHIPMAMLFRSQHHDQPASPCEGFQPHLDALEAANPTRLEQACTLIHAMLDNLELNAIPEPLFTGVPCPPAAGVLTDELIAFPDDAMTQPLAFSMDGRRSLASLATDLSLPLARVRALADRLVSHSLCQLHAAPPRRSAI